MKVEAVYTPALYKWVAAGLTNRPGRSDGRRPNLLYLELINRACPVGVWIKISAAGWHCASKWYCGYWLPNIPVASFCQFGSMALLVKQMKSRYDTRYAKIAFSSLGTVLLCNHTGIVAMTHPGLW